MEIKPLPPPSTKLIPPNDDYPFFEEWSAHPLVGDATGFSLVNAWRLAEVALLAYSAPAVFSGMAKRAGFDTKPFGGKSTQCFVAFDDRVVLVAFRGTEVRPDGGFANVVRDVLADANVVPVGENGGLVHKGFRDALDEVWSDLKGFLDAQQEARKLWITGHSLGAALATLASSRLKNVQGLYSYGSPRVCDAAFGRHFREQGFRFVNGEDVVTRVPFFPYEHVGTLKFFDADGVLHDRMGLVQEAMSFLEARINRLLGATHPRLSPSALEALLVPKGLADHAPLYYALRCRNLFATSF